LRWKHSGPRRTGGARARIEEEIVVTATGTKVITRFRQISLMVAGAHYFTVNGPLSTTRENEAPPKPTGERDGGSQPRKSKEWRLRTEGASRLLTKTMAISVVMPALEMAQENGKLLAWRKKKASASRRRAVARSRDG